MDAINSSRCDARVPVPVQLPRCVPGVGCRPWGCRVLRLFVLICDRCLRKNMTIVSRSGGRYGVGGQMGVAGRFVGVSSAGREVRPLQRRAKAKGYVGGDGLRFYRGSRAAAAPAVSPARATAVASRGPHTARHFSSHDWRECAATDGPGIVQSRPRRRRRCTVSGAGLTRRSSGSLGPRDPGTPLPRPKRRPYRLRAHPTRA